MICPLMSKLTVEPPVKIECGESCAWYIATAKICAVREMAEKADVFEVAATLQEVNESLVVIGKEVVKKL